MGFGILNEFSGFFMNFRTLLDLTDNNNIHFIDVSLHIHFLPPLVLLPRVDCVVGRDFGTFFSTRAH
jgi:hypothetical protein